MYVSNYEKVIIEKAKRETAEEVTKKKNLETLKNLLAEKLGLDAIKRVLALPDNEFNEMLQLAQKS